MRNNDDSADEHAADDYAAFVRANSHSLFGTALLLTSDASAAEELLQETLVLLYPKWDRVRAADSQLAYVRRCVVNRFVSSRRTRRHEPAVSHDVAEMWDGVDALAAVLDRAVLRSLLRSLTPTQRAAIVLRYLHDLPDAEIATTLGRRPVTVRSLISRGLAVMRAELGNRSDPLATESQEAPT